MIAEGNRNLLITGLEPGRFTELPGGGGVVYVGSMSTDGTRMSRIFVYKQAGDRLDVTTARSGAMSIDGSQRYLRLEDGFRVEGPRETGRDFRLMRYGSNDLLLPDAERGDADGKDPQAMTTPALLQDSRREATAQLHYRIAPPLLALAFALLAVPLARSSPRQARYGRILIGFLAYLIGMNLTMLGTDWLGSGKLPLAAGLWWLVLPLLALAVWMYFDDGRVRRARPWR
jgi:lipopolysaccharide export system permease protein